ncbi:MAG: hypothetical protein JNM94_03470 [Phycisphaerae bacterium]|nr:hypothetical protein [Phycisphaerae bacterium]
MTLDVPTPRSRSRGRAIAVAISLALHVGIFVALGTLAVDTLALRGNAEHVVDFVVADLPQEEAPPTLPRVTATVAEPASESALPNAVADRIADRLSAPTPTTSDTIADRLRDRLVSGATPTAADAPTKTAGPAATVTFVGVEADRAASVVYVVDASGSLVGTLPIVLDELERSIERLSPAQRFGVVFFQRNAALSPPGSDALRSADPRAVRETMAWAREKVRPSGRSNPLAAIERALAWKPDVVFLLSTSITGSGEFEISQAELLDRLEALNPPDAQGVRRTRIHCIQFLDPDPNDTLKAIAKRHAGSEGYRYLSREQLGLKRSRP